MLTHTFPPSLVRFNPYSVRFGDATSQGLEASHGSGSMMIDVSGGGGDGARSSSPGRKHSPNSKLTPPPSALKGSRMSRGGSRQGQKRPRSGMSSVSGGASVTGSDLEYSDNDGANRSLSPSSLAGKNKRKPQGKKKVVQRKSSLQSSASAGKWG